LGDDFVVDFVAVLHRINPHGSYHNIVNGEPNCLLPITGPFGGETLLLILTDIGGKIRDSVRCEFRPAKSAKHRRKGSVDLEDTASATSDVYTSGPLSACWALVCGTEMAGQ
jgi:hypothetical protein